MPKLPDPELRRLLSEKVASRVAGRGIPQSAVDDAVQRVIDALAASGDLPRTTTPAGPSSAERPPATMIAALSARSVPDLASRVRRDLEREGIVLEEMGLGAAGQHTVVAVKVSATARPALERLAERSRYALSFLNIDAGASTA
jgi:hypothetical protein